MNETDQAYNKLVNECANCEDTAFFEELRKTEYPLLDERNHVYLDYTGGNLFPRSLINAHMELLCTDVYGNPHSSNPISQATTKLVNRARKKVLEFFNANPDEYEVVFTKNTSEALKLVGESYPFSEGDQYLLTVDNHNSVLGIREYDRVSGARTIYAPIKSPEMTIDEEKLEECLDMAMMGKNNLFAYPAQSNFSGIKHSLDWVRKAQDKGWDVILDAAAYVPTSKLDLSVVKPDYTTVSFYKMFGYPTGVGALIAKKKALRKLHRPWFGGGTIVAVSVAANTHHPAQGAAGFEDGTVNYLNIPAIQIGLEFLEKIGMDRINQRVTCLSQWLIQNLKELKHNNGTSLIKFYGDTDSTPRGGTMAMNFFKADEEQFDTDKVQAIANNLKISFRTGCFCNPGISETAFNVEESEIFSCIAGASSYESTDDYRVCVGSIGAIRISVGFVSTFKDVYTFYNFARSFLNKNSI